MNEINIAVILLNWNNADATIKCIESVLAGSILPTSIVVIDNHSADDSLKVINSWCKNYLYKRQIENSNETNVILLESNVNSGYAGGNNIGIEFAKNKLSSECFWILNNDAQPDKNALEELLLIAKNNTKSFVSSVTLYENGLIEAYGGGTYFPIFGKAKLLHKKKRYQPDLKISVNYLMGASLLLPCEIIDKVGYMDECFFMYSEEIDWQWRAINKGYEIQVAPKSIVYHAGSSSTESYQYHYYRNRAAIMFNSIYFGCLYSIVSGLALSVYTAVRYAFKPKLVIFGIKGCFQGVCKKRKDKMLPLKSTVK